MKIINYFCAAYYKVLQIIKHCSSLVNFNNSKMIFLKQTFVGLLLLFIPFSIFSQDERAQLPGILKNAYFGVSVGSINYDFGKDQFQTLPGYKYNKVTVNHTAVRLVLYGYEFNKYLSAQITYMRPVSWVFYYYNRENESLHRSSVWMNVGGLTLKPQFPINKKLYISGEAGLGIVTRHGFNAENGSTPIISGESYPTVLLGAGLNYYLTDSWRLMLSGAYTPEKNSVRQPATTFISSGFNYKLKPVTKKKIELAANTGFINPKQWFQIGYSSNAIGYGINNALEKVSLFWGGDVELFQGLTLNYQRNIYHSAKVFALDWGVSASSWQTTGIGRSLNNPNKQNFVTLSIYPVLRFNIIHSKPLDIYFYYSVAGPTYISKTDFQIQNKFGVPETALTGKHFTFQDNMGVGTFFGAKRNFNAEIKIGHYSNGNLFPVNAAVKIPLSINVGYAF